MREKVESIKNRFMGLNINTLNELNEVRVLFVGKKGLVTNLLDEMNSLNIEDKKEFGKLINDLKNEIIVSLEEKRLGLENVERENKLSKEKIDITLPATKINLGSPSIIEKLLEEVESLFISMGYDVVEGPEVEEDLYNFELLNLPKGHPARDAQDTFYVEDESLLLRSQTSPVQIRTMLANKDKTSVKIICPGKTYRRDDDDATHSHQFTQIEGLFVDKNISLAHLKGTMDVMAKKLFGDDTTTRFRPSFYPFTEPSVELDISCFNCKGKGCNICKNTGWITVAGAGMVHPNVLKNCGYDPNIYSGFAFGFGAERLAMLKYGITDIRTFYTNDLRETKVYDRRDV